MSVSTLNTEERIAVAICWLYRWRGTRAQAPVVAYEVSERHGVTCDWCEYPMERLISLCDLRGSPDIDIFKRFPAKTQRELVIAALHEKRP